MASIITILRMPPLTSSTAYIAVLAAGDNFALITKLVLHQLTKHDVIGVWGCRLLYYLGSFSIMYVNWILVAMTVERFIAIWFPLKVVNYCNWKNACYAMTGVAVVLLLANLQFLWSQTQSSDGKGDIHCKFQTEYETFIYLYWYWIDGALYAIVPCILLFVFNFLIIFGIRKSTRIQEGLIHNKSRHTTETMKQQRQITIMLVVVSVVFVLLILPNCLFFIIKAYWIYTPNSYEHVIFLLTEQLIFVLADSNHAVNFYLYFLSGKKFRKRFFDTIFCRHIARRTSTEFKRSSNNDSTGTSNSFSPLHRHQTSF
ncbi:hypothetical protein LOTGIDRAFT_156728 [Lottia gigantea]|uniref:G-protein coupled receptors family 1 profile domain-containing protein n=1 Tax=Lottia gigantea TaxID=225164 RepID=V4AYQ8_LOTGI|nr:hypothetical protein LOTGIDRAFT_156728 [Lottia gigantea]ESP02783.1 hypothetical protein LOTGIDRAFT_156728 [Lottia gigantea]